MGRKIKKIVFGILQMPFLQGFFEKLLLFSLRAMNFGGGAQVHGSGEDLAFRNAMSEIKKNRSEIVVFDVGANVGDYSLMALGFLRNLGSVKFHIHAFEPSQKTHEILKSKVGNFTEVTLVKKAVGEKHGSVELFSDPQDSGLSSLYHRNLDFAGKNMSARETVEITSLDEYCIEKGIGGIDYLKMDIEGHELKALLGAKNLIDKGGIKYIQFEFGGANIDSKTYFKDFFYLLHPKYKIYRILKNGVYPIKTYKEIYEIFITSNYVAVLNQS